MTDLCARCGAAADPPEPAIEVLSTQQLRVLELVANGRPNAEIAGRLFITEDTVKAHIRRIFAKLGARSRSHAVAQAFRAGIELADLDEQEVGA